MKKFAMTLTVTLITSLVAVLLGAVPAGAAQTPTRANAVVSSATTPLANRIKPRKLTKERKIEIRNTAAALSVPSAWRGVAMYHPAGTKFPKAVSRWANMVSYIMEQHKIPAQYLNGILAQIQQESYGDPTVVNMWDSNYRRGTPSMGLLQVIAPTYLQYARRGLRQVKFQALPYANIFAALKYAKSRYGMSKFAKWSVGQNEGY